MKTRVKKLIICVAIPLLVGGLSAFISKDSMQTFELLYKPTVSPPGYVFPVVWTILYVLMGIASYLVLTSKAKQGDIDNALMVYGFQLAANFLWPIFFFSFGWYLFSFFWLILLWVLILATTIMFSRISKPAAYLMIPYLLWVAFAGYLNLAIYLMN